MYSRNQPLEHRLDALELLNSHNVKNLIIGGYAVVYHGHPGANGDIDFFIPFSYWGGAECASPK